MKSFRISLAAAAAVLVACSACYAWQNGPSGQTQGYLWGGQAGWGQSHFHFAPPSEYGAISSQPPQLNQQQRQRIQQDLSQWRPGLLTPSRWLTVGRPVPIPRRTNALEQPAAKAKADSQGFAPPADGRSLQVAPQRVRSRVLEFNPQSGKLEDANVIRW